MVIKILTYDIGKTHFFILQIFPLLTNKLLHWQFFPNAQK
jgi:hypothetical protein